MVEIFVVRIWQHLQLLCGTKAAVSASVKLNGSFCLSSSRQSSNLWEETNGLRALLFLVLWWTSVRICERFIIFNTYQQQHGRRQEKHFNHFSLISTMLLDFIAFFINKTTLLTTGRAPSSHSGAVRNHDGSILDCMCDKVVKVTSLVVQTASRTRLGRKQVGPPLSEINVQSVRMRRCYHRTVHNISVEFN